MKHLLVTGCAALLLVVAGCGNHESKDETTDSMNQVKPNPDEQGRTDTTWKSDTPMINDTKREAPLK